MLRLPHRLFYYNVYRIAGKIHEGFDGKRSGYNQHVQILSRVVLRPLVNVPNAMATHTHTHTSA